MARISLVATFLVIGVIGGTIAAQQPAPRPPTRVTANFTGTVNSLDASDVRSVRFQYDAGARSYWHSHEGIQVLVIEKGRGRIDRKSTRLNSSHIQKSRMPSSA